MFWPLLESNNTYNDEKKMIQGRFVNRYFGLYYPSNNLLLPSAPSFGKQGFLNGDNSETFF